MNRVVGNLKTSAPRIRKIEPVKLEILKIAYAIASKTNQVMMMVRVGVETGHGVEVICVSELS